jgi:Indigoidine synthase A like protein
MPPLSRGLQRFWSCRSCAKLPLTPFRRRFGSRNDFLKVSEEVQDALENGKPVVALETTIYTHGTYLSRD